MGAGRRADDQSFGFRDLSAVLRLGWRDFTRAPLYGLFFAAVYGGRRLADLWR